MWVIKTTDRFDSWFTRLCDSDRASVLAAMISLQERGPGLPRPWADTLKGSRYVNMKELRIQCRGYPVRAFFAFDPDRTGVLLCAGHKSGNEKRFYEVMIPIADREFTHWLKGLKQKR
ncbi:diaminopimelate decarboxylase [Candidatus Pantoea deserta]|uniref:Diaminopimelate decarboxylase n=1 Tax=Candidatus Pantoea deserta TaxID=1869313 RepID=A0A3N4P2J7_9GAMM|nr:type II toxin-antitoxin system RelE/ParE family toxin [Pantoea deserta]RPE02852.1 diaminopimelate decarboxylase [Pantoea deserta]